VSEPSARRRKRLLLVVSSFDHPGKDLVTAAVSIVGLNSGWLTDCYYTSPPSAKAARYVEEAHPAAASRSALFSTHGSTPLGGRHAQALARACAEFDVTVINLGGVHAFQTLFDQAARAVHTCRDIVEVLQVLRDELACELPSHALVVQTEQLPEQLGHGISQYVSPEAQFRNAVPLPLELSTDDVHRLVDLGLDAGHVLAVADHPGIRSWSLAGLKVSVVDTLAEDDSYDTFTFRIARRWADELTGIDLCEPVLASYWLPYVISHRRAQVCAEDLQQAAALLADLLPDRAEPVVFGRYSGGLLSRARDDRDLFPLFRRNVSYQVVEPHRPVLRVLAEQPRVLPRPVLPSEPSDEQLEDWADRGCHLVGLVFHSGELSHDDGITNVLDMVALTGVPVGIPVQAARYQFDPDCVEPMHTPVAEGGTLGLAEPLLHSSGFGILAERLADPGRLAEAMAEARNRITAQTGPDHAPRGVYCYLDADTKAWHLRHPVLWKAVADQGFDYLISSVQPGESKLLYCEGNFVVINLTSLNYFPYSPFVRINSAEQLRHAERRWTASGRPGWQLHVLDTPALAYQSYLLKGRSAFSDRSHLNEKTELRDFFEYIAEHGETRKLIPALPRTIARYARILYRRGQLTP